MGRHSNSLVGATAALNGFSRDSPGGDSEGVSDTPLLSMGSPLNGGPDNVLELLASRPEGRSARAVAESVHLTAHLLRKRPVRRESECN